MEKVANLLRQTREQQSISLEEAAQRTRIPISYLALLEGIPLNDKSRTRPLPDPLYLVPHLRKYATFLGLDPSFMTAQFTTVLQDAQEKSVKITAPAVSPQLLPTPPRRSRAISISIVLASVLVTLAFIGQYADMNARAPGGGDTRLPFPTELPSASKPLLAPAPPSPISPSPEEPRRDAPLTPSSLPPQNATTPSAATRTPPGAAPLAALQTEPTSPSAPSLTQRPARVSGLPHVLRAQATEATWIRVYMDGQSPKEMILRPGQSAEWTSNSPFQLTLGNAGGVTLNLDGQDLPSFGKSGQVIRNIRLPALPPENQG
jgi:cytoskeleton protein RodZ